jgi:Single-strand binding protein family
MFASPPLLPSPQKMAVVLIAGLVCSLPRPSIPANGRPHTAFHLKAESDGQIWKVTVFHEDEIAVVDALAVGDAVALTGNLDVHPEEDRLGRRRIAYCVVAKQLLLLRARSAAKARATSFFDPPTAGGIVRPRIG